MDLHFPGPIVAYAWPSIGDQARYAEDRRRCRPGQPAALQLRRLLDSLLSAVRSETGCCIHGLSGTHRPLLGATND